MIEAFPKADTETIQTIEDTVKSLSDFDAYFSSNNGFSLKKLLTDLAHPYEVQIHKEFDVKPYCPCTKNGVMRTLASLGPQELHNIAKEKKETEIFIYHLNTHFIFSHIRSFSFTLLIPLLTIITRM